MFVLLLYPNQDQPSGKKQNTKKKDGFQTSYFAKVFGISNFRFIFSLGLLLDDNYTGMIIEGFKSNMHSRAAATARTISSKAGTEGCACLSIGKAAFWDGTELTLPYIFLSYALLE